MVDSRLVSSVSAATLFVAELVCLLLSLCVYEVCMETCDADVRFVNRSYVQNQLDVFTNLQKPCEPNQRCGTGMTGSENTCAENSHDGTWSEGRCRCKCGYSHRTFNFIHCVDLEGFQSSSGSNCNVSLEMSQPAQVPIRKLPGGGAGYIEPMENSILLGRNGNPIAREVLLQSMEYFGHDQQWKPLSHRVGLTGQEIFVIERETWRDTDSEVNYIKYMYNPPQGQSIESCFDGLIIKLTLKIGRSMGTDPPMTKTDCVLLKLAGELKYNINTGILPCVQSPTTTHNTEAGDATVPSSSNVPSTSRKTTSTTSFLQHVTDKISTSEMQSGEKDGMKSSPIGAIVGGVCAAAVIFIIGGVVLFILWRRKFRPSLSKKSKNQRVTMSSLQNGHPTEGMVDNEIYAGDNAGIVDNVIYEGGMGADGVFSNPGYADKTPQFKPRMDAPGAFVQPNPGATNKTPTPQRNIIIEEPQYAQIVDDQYADPQKVRDRKDKKNKKKATKDENYADLKGPHEKQPGANNSNSNHIYQGLNKGTDYQSLRGPREHHHAKPSQVPKTPQDEHDYTSITPGRSKPSAGTLPKEEADYTVLEGPESPGEETAAGPDYTTLDGPDSPGDEITSSPDYTVLDGPDSPGD